MTLTQTNEPTATPTDEVVATEEALVDSGSGNVTVTIETPTEESPPVTVGEGALLLAFGVFSGLILRAWNAVRKGLNVLIEIGKQLEIIFADLRGARELNGFFLKLNPDTQDIFRQIVRIADASDAFIPGSLFTKAVVWAQVVTAPFVGNTQGVG